jgi:hypothetical protein
MGGLSAESNLLLILQPSAEVSRGLAYQESTLKHLTTSLVSAGAIEDSELENSELDTAIHIEIRIEGHWSERSVPLPKYTPIEFRLR